MCVMAESLQMSNTKDQDRTGMLRRPLDGSRPPRESDLAGLALAGGQAAKADVSLLRAMVVVALAVWMSAVVVLGARGAFVRPPGTPPLPIALGFAAPIVVFFVAFLASASFRDFLAGRDLSLLTAIQSWRFAGFGFIALYVSGVLPGAFAWPAGLGDMAIGLTAPWVALWVAHRPGFAAGRLFVIWNLLGILDLVAAVANGAFNQVLATGATGEITTAPMAQMPLVLIPAFLVPLFLMLHVTALFQARQLTRPALGKASDELDLIVE
jgi:hypothetical protein